MTLHEEFPGILDVLDHAIRYAEVGYTVLKGKVWSFNQTKLVKEWVLASLWIDVETNDALALALQDSKLASEPYSIVTVSPTSAAEVNSQPFLRQQGVHSRVENHGAVDIGVTTEAALGVEALLQVHRPSSC
jgi:hypothetical protein